MVGLMVSRWCLFLLVTGVSLADPRLEGLSDIALPLPAPDCCFNDTVVKHGGVAAAHPAKCLQLVCRRGKIQTRFTDTAGDSFCCEFAGRLYRQGAELDGHCVTLVCTKLGWMPGSAIKECCSHCCLHDDPHIYTFDGHQYDWHGTCNYSVAQTDSSFDPHTGLFSDFQPCNTHASCLRHTTFRDNPHTILSLANDNIYNVLVNGDLFTVEAESVASPVYSSSGAHPVLAWRNGQCIMLLGASRVMVQHCPHRLDVWAHPRHADALEGLCGRYNYYTDDDLTTRDGDVYDLEYWPVAFPVSWLTRDQIDFMGHNRVKQCMPREANPCHADGKLQAQYLALCRAFLGHIVDRDDRLLPHLRTCVLDVCVMRQAGRGEGAGRRWLLALADNVMTSAAILNLTLHSPRPPLGRTNVTLETCGCVSQLLPALHRLSRQLPPLLMFLVDIQRAIRDYHLENTEPKQPQGPGYNTDDQGNDEYDNLGDIANKTLILETLADQTGVMVTVLKSALSALVSGSAPQPKGVVAVTVGVARHCPAGHVQASRLHLQRVAQEVQVVRGSLPRLHLGQEFVLAVQVLTEKIAWALAAITELRENLEALPCY